MNYPARPSQVRCRILQAGQGSLHADIVALVGRIAMATPGTGTLSKLSETGQTVASDDEDIRGRKVKDKDGEDVGKVADLLIDDAEHKVRFLLVEHGGFLGIGDTKSFIPVDAITRITADDVFVDQSRE